MSLITSIKAQATTDSRHKPTLEVTVYSGNEFASCIVPSGASTGSKEALELRDADGGVNSAINNIKLIEEILVGQDIADQKNIDSLMIKRDGTSNKKVLGGNVILGTSIACAKLGAFLTAKPFHLYLKEQFNQPENTDKPKLFMNLINGGQHAPYGSPFQEYQIIPETDDPEKAHQAGKKIFETLQQLITDHQWPIDKMGDEGGFILRDKSLTLPLDLLTIAIEKSVLDFEIAIGLDVAANSFFSNGSYQLDNQALNSEALSILYLELIKNYNIRYIEDPFQEEDFKAFGDLIQKDKSGVMIIGDDLTVTNKQRLQTAIDNKSIHTLIIKPNQIGTISEMAETISLANQNNIKCIASHRSGETKDTFISDIALAFNCFGLKAGAPEAPLREEKYLRLISLLK